MLRKEMRRMGGSFNEAVKHFLRLGLMGLKKPKRKPFVVTPLPLGLPPELNYDNVEELIEALEGPLHR
jgi:hypothetical protein